MTEERTDRRTRMLQSPLAAAAVATVLALLVRWWTFADLHAADPLLRVAILDDRAYLELAAAMARGDGGDWFLAPLHPWLAARLAGGAEVTLRLLGGLNLGLGALTSGVVALAAARIAGRASAGWSGGLIHALAGCFVFHDVLPGQEAAIGLFTAVAILAGAALLGEPGTGRRALAWAVLIGLATGIAAMGRGSSLVLVLCALPGLLPREGRGLRGAAVALGLCVALAPAGLRNLSVAETLSPFPWSGGVNLYLANGPDARAAVAMTSHELGATPESIEFRSQRIAAQRSGRDVSPRETSSWWAARTFDEWGGPAAAGAHLGRKALLFFAARERGSNHAASAERGFATYTGLVPVAAWWLLALGGGAWWLVRRRAPAADVAILAVAGTWLALIVFFPVDRFRMPATVASAVLVGVAAGLLPEFRNAVEARRLRASAMVVVGVTVLAWLPVGAPDRGGGHLNVARAFAELGESSAVVEEHLALALAAEPDHGPALEMLGRRRIAEGQSADGFALLVRAASDDRSRISAQIAALPAMVDLGQAASAWRAAQGLLTEAGENPELLANAAVAAGAAGDRRAATELLVRAQAIAPRHPAVLAAGARLR